MKRLSTVLIALYSVILILPGPALATDQAVVTFLHFNDLDRMSPSKGKGGIAALGAVIEDERQRADNPIVTFGGDMLSPSLMASIDQGQHMVDLFSQIGIDAATLGNHEFDFGPDVAREKISQGNIPWLAANIRDSAGNPFAHLPESKIIDVGTFKVGLFGVTTPATTEISSPGEELRFLPIADTAQHMAERLRADGADLVVMLAHEGFFPLSRVLAAAPGVDIALGGHDHLALSYYDGRQAVMTGGSQGEFLAVMAVTLTREENRGQLRVTWNPDMRLVATDGVAAHAGLEAVVAKYEAQLDEALGAKIGVTETELDTRRAAVRAEETRFGNLVAEVLKDSLDADIGLMNGGGIRGDRTYPAGSDLTIRDIVSELPFGNVGVKVRISGALLREVLENGVSSVESVAGRFPQIAGLSFAYDPSRPPGARVVDILVAGEKLDPKAQYTLATNDYVAGGGDGYDVLTQGEVLLDAKDGVLIANMVRDHIAGLGRIAPVTDGRILRIE